MDYGVWKVFFNTAMEVIISVMSCLKNMLYNDTVATYTRLMQLYEPWIHVKVPRFQAKHVLVALPR